MNILIKNEPDHEVGGISNGVSNTRDLQISLIKEELDDDNYYVPDTLLHNDIVIIDDDTDAEIEIDDEPSPSSSTEKSKNIAKKEKTVHGKAIDSIENFTIKCRARGKCKDLFESWDAMKYHMTTYHARIQKQNTFECHLCKKTLGEKQTHQRHMNLYHFGQSLFKCSFGTCSKSFPRQDYLEKHINAEHTKQYRIKCPKCPKKFNFKVNLKVHLSSVHGEGMSFSCYLCKKKLCEKRSLQCHMISQHTGQFVYKCPVCSKGFGSKRRFRMHFTRKTLICGRTAAASDLKL